MAPLVQVNLYVPVVIIVVIAVLAVMAIAKYFLPFFMGFCRFSLLLLN